MIYVCGCNVTILDPEVGLQWGKTITCEVADRVIVLVKTTFGSSSGVFVTVPKARS